MNDATGSNNTDQPRAVSRSQNAAPMRPMAGGFGHHNTQITNHYQAGGSTPGSIFSGMASKQIISSNNSGPLSSNLFGSLQPQMGGGGSLGGRHGSQF